MYEDDMLSFEKIIDDPDAPEHIKFKAEILLLFDKYDPYRPGGSITPEEFIGTLMMEMMNMNFHINMAMNDSQ